MMSNAPSPHDLEQCVLLASDPSTPLEQRNTVTEVLNAIRNDVPLNTAAQQCLQILCYSKNTQALFFAWSTLHHCLSLSLAQECAAPGSATTRSNRASSPQRGLVEEASRTRIRTMVLHTTTNNNNIDSNGSIPVETYLRTKMGVVLTLILQLEFPLRWPTAFDDVIQVLVVNSSVATQEKDYTEHVLRLDLFLRILDAFCDEIVDGNLHHMDHDNYYGGVSVGSALNDRNTAIKDLIRGLSVVSTDGQISNVVNHATVNPTTTIVVRLMETMLHIASRYHTTTSNHNNKVDTNLPSLALSVMKRFIPWIDLSLIVNSSVIPFLFSCFTKGLCHGDAEDDVDTAVAIQATDCLYELVNRGMVLRNKIQLLVDIQIFTNLIRVQQDPANVADNTVKGLILDEHTNIHLAIKIAQLVDITGLELLECWEKQGQALENAELVQKTASLLHQFIPAFFLCFAYDDIDVTGAVLPVANSLVISLGKELKQQHQQQQQTQFNNKYQHFTLTPHLPQLLSILYSQMQYPSDFQFDYNSEDDAEEQVFRYDLRKLYIKIVRSCPNDITLQFLCQIFANGIPNIAPLSGAPCMHLEAALRLLYHYSEGIKPVRSSVPSSSYVMLKMEPFYDLVLALHQSDVSHHPHQEIVLLYYDIAVRYLYAFKNKPDLLPVILDAISGPRGLQHATSARVRSRSCYLMLRLVKGMSAEGRMRGYVETAVRGIQGLLSNPELHLQHDDTLYLFETVGLLLGTRGNLTPEAQTQYLTAVISPHVHSIEQTLLSPLLQQDPAHYGQVLSQSIAAISYLSKGFGYDPQEDVQLVLAETLNVSLHVLQAFPGEEEVRNKTMILIQRMILCLKRERVFSFLPSFLHILIDHCTSDDILNVCQMLNQICIKYTGDAARSLDGAVVPFVQKCQSLVTSIREHASDGANVDIYESTENNGKAKVDEAQLPPHLEVELLSIQKLAYIFLHHVVNHNVTVILLSPGNAPHLEKFLQFMLDGATKMQVPIIKKTCISFFQCLINQWASADNIDVGGNPQQFAIVQDGFFRFVFQTVVPGLFLCITDPSFNDRDALQARNVSEIGLLLSTLKVKRGPAEFAHYVLNQTLVRSYNCDGDLLTNFGNATSPKEMGMWLKAFLAAKKAK